MTTYTPDEAAELLGITPHSVRTFIQRGMIAAVKRKGRWALTAEEIARYNRERNPQGRRLGYRLSEVSRQKVRAAKLAYNPMKGKKHTPETRAKISAVSAKQPRGDKSHAWRGGRTTDTSGYAWVFAPDHPYVINRYVLEHRLVMEQVLGRYLTPDEVVHHKNGDITDNRPENLQVMTASEHSRFHRLNPTLKSNRRR